MKTSFFPNYFSFLTSFYKPKINTQKMENFIMEDTILHHIALQYTDKEDAETFFTKILGLQLEKIFTISSDLSNKIFGIKENIEVLVYNSEKARFEIFITKKQKPTSGFDHTCIVIDNKEEFIKRCKQYNLQPNLVDKNGGQLLFVTDFSGNLFEIKEK
jgi:catechol-2,3-dioxygenase